MAVGKKTGGRKAGTPNKVSSIVRAAITHVVDDYYNSETFQHDIAELEPRDRVAAMEKLSAYVLPKLQTTTLDVATETKKTIEDQLIELSAEKDEE